MAKEIFMPKLSSTMEVGTLLQWLKEEGDTVNIGDPLFEIMTDKINIEVESYEEGVLLKKYYDVDSEVPINTVIGFIGEAGEEVPDNPPSAADDEKESVAVEEESTEVEVEESDIGNDESSTDKVRATPAARRVAKENDIELSLIAGTGPKGRIHEQDVIEYLNSNKINATPLAVKMMEDAGYDPKDITGSGVHGKINKEDVLSYGQSLQSNSEEAPERVKLSGLRKMIANKMVESTTTIPHVNLTTEVDMEKVMDIRKALLPSIESETGYRLSFTEIIMKATANTLLHHPKVNASLIDDEIVYNRNVNLGLAVALEDGLIVPVVKNVSQKGLSQLTVESKELGRNARNNQLSPDDLKGGTFTISNLGMYAIDAFTPIINPPETAILGVGRIVKKPVVINDDVVIKPMMTLSLSFDHRAMDGAPAAAFLTELKENLENPYRLFM